MVQFSMPLHGSLNSPCSDAHVLNLDNGIVCLTGASKTAERLLYEVCMNACLRDGEVWVAGFDDKIQAVSFWTRPGTDFHIG
jgi:hypothetical protein